MTNKAIIEGTERYNRIMKELTGFYPLSMRGGVKDQCQILYSEGVTHIVKQDGTIIPPYERL